MKKFFSFVIILSIIGCAGNQAKEASLKVYVSPLTSTFITKRIGVLPFTSENESLGLYLSDAVADNLVTSGLYIIEHRHLLTELEKLLKREEHFDETNEWESFKRLFAKKNNKVLISNLIKLRELDLVDYLLIGNIKTKDKLFSESNDVVEANLDIIDVQNGGIVSSLNYSRGRSSSQLTPTELGEKLAQAMIKAIQ